jgi:hypothetical protein
VRPPDQATTALRASADEPQWGGEDEITKALGIQPTMTWSPGDKVRNTRLVHKENGWSIDINLADAIDWLEHVERLLSEVHPFHQDLARRGFERSYRCRSLSPRIDV